MRWLGSAHCKISANPAPSGSATISAGGVLLSGIIIFTFLASVATPASAKRLFHRGIAETGEDDGDGLTEELGDGLGEDEVVGEGEGVEVTVTDGLGLDEVVGDGVEVMTGEGLVEGEEVTDGE